MIYSITKCGTPLDKSLYTINEKTKTFSSNEDYLALDFSSEFGWTFNTGSDYTFDTGSGCTFKTGSGCTFKTGKECVVVRRDVYEVIELKENVKIKLNERGIKGYEIIEDEKKKEEITTFNKEDIKKKIFELIDKLTGE